MKFIEIATILAVPTHAVIWCVGVFWTISYRRKIRIEDPKEYESRGGVRNLWAFLRRKEYQEFGTESFVVESELLRFYTKACFTAFAITFALLAIFFYTR